MQEYAPLIGIAIYGLLLGFLGLYWIRQERKEKKVVPVRKTFFISDGYDLQPSEDLVNAFYNYYGVNETAFDSAYNTVESKKDIAGMISIRAGRFMYSLASIAATHGITEVLLTKQRRFLPDVYSGFIAQFHLKRDPRSDDLLNALARELILWIANKGGTLIIPGDGSIESFHVHNWDLILWARPLKVKPTNKPRATVISETEMLNEQIRKEAVAQGGHSTKSAEQVERILRGTAGAKEKDKPKNK